MLQPKALAVVNQVRQVILGKDTVICKVLMAILAKGHILLEGQPRSGENHLGFGLFQGHESSLQPGSIYP